MTLSFTQKINGKPNYFVHKIWRGILYHRLSDADFVSFCYQPWFKKFGETCPMMDGLNVPPKLHTIRLDPHNRWRPGMKIHPVINNRSENRFQFAPTMLCMSTHRIDVVRKCNDIDVGWIYVDGKPITGDKIIKLAINDGFDSVEDFFNYFNKDFTGKLIHWTDLKY